MPVPISNPARRWDGQTTVYVGGYYEKNVSTGQETKYYTFGGRRVAVRMGSTVYWVLVDQLQSTMVLLDGNGNKVGEKWYYPFGEERHTSGSLFTDRRFTGQRWDGTIGLYDYRARYYDPALGRFVQADTVVPEPGNPQALNRYAYALNNPLRYTDPTGHCIPGETCRGNRYSDEPVIAPPAKTLPSPATLPTPLRPQQIPLEDILPGLFVEELGPPEIDQWFDPLTSDPEDAARLRAELLPVRDPLYGSTEQLLDLAQGGQNNPLTTEQVKERLGPEDTAHLLSFMAGRANNLPLQLFLKAMKLSSDLGWNYEPFYMEALMVTHPRKLLKAEVEFTKLWLRDPVMYEAFTKTRFPSGQPPPPQ